MAARAHPPEGGYAWVIVGCYVTNFACVIQLVQMMGLVLKDVFEDLGISDSQGASIITASQAVSMALGLLAGPLIRRLGFRAGAALGAVLAAAGLALLSTATTVSEFVLYYDVVMSAGLSLSYPSYIVALNAYFAARRTLATGVALALTGALAALTPPLVSAASAHFGPRPALLLLAGAALQTLVGAALLRPLRPARPARRARHVHVQKEEEGPCAELLCDCRDAPGVPRRHCSRDAAASAVEEHASEDTVLSVVDEAKAKPAAASPARRPPGLLRSAVDVFGLGLLRDPSFASLVVGASLGLFADVNLVQFLPFLLAARGLDTADAATCMSALCLADTAFRLVAPPLHRACARPSRVMYLGTLGALAAARTALLWCESFTAVLVVSALTGASRGVNVVFLQTVIPDNVAPDRLPSAQGVYMLTNGIVFLTVGSAMGWLLGRTGDYGVVVASLLAVNALTAATWAAESALKALFARRSRYRLCEFAPRCDPNGFTTSAA